MKGKTLMKSLALGLLVLAFAVTAFAADTIKIPVASPFTGQLASFGEGVKNGAMLKAEEVNAAGGVNGKKVEIVLGDELCDPKEAANVATKFAADSDVSIVVGHLCSSATLAALPIYKDAKLPAISPASTNPTIGKSSPYYFRNVYMDDFQGSFLAKYVKSVKGWEKITIFYETNDYSIGLKDAFIAEAKNQGLKILGTEAYTNETTDFTPQLTKFRAMKPDALFIPGYAPQGTLIVAQAAKLGMKVGFFGADGIDDAMMLENPDAEGLFVTTPFLADNPNASDVTKAFVKGYKAKFGVEPNWFAANTYDAVGMAVEAIKNVGADREKIRGYLAGIDSPGKAYVGVTGPTYFDANGDVIKGAFVKEIKGGKWISSQKQL
ncbi:MAG: ABC transporter substrate-binding protein [bacterium]|nr:MAG: ABC transporter substrate-binding protein [bacterium]